MAYTVSLLPASEREWRKLPREIRDCVNRTLLALEELPRPHGVAKLAGSLDRWRIRVGDYCIIYRVDDAEHEVVVLRIAHRRQVYR
jgi:mRNA interferase RelE/StbE